MAFESALSSEILGHSVGFSSIPEIRFFFQELLTRVQPAKILSYCYCFNLRVFNSNSLFLKCIYVSFILQVVHDSHRKFGGYRRIKVKKKLPPPTNPSQF